MKKYVITALFSMSMVIAAGFGFLPAFQTEASACSFQDERCKHTEPSIAKQVFQKFAEECGKQVEGGQQRPKLCFVADIYNKILPTLKALSRDGRLVPGERVLLFGEAQEGTLRLGIGRTFVAPSPALKDSFTVKVQKKSGNGGAFVRICAVDDKGAVTHLGSIKFDDGGKAETKSLTVTGAREKVLTTRVESFSGSFDYTMTTTPN